MGGETDAGSQVGSPPLSVSLFSVSDSVGDVCPFLIFVGSLSQSAQPTETNPRGIKKGVGF